MAKSRNKKKKHASSTPMEIASDSPLDRPQAMNMSEINSTDPALGVMNRNIKKGPCLRRAKKLKKLKAAERAISNNEKLEELMSKKKGKVARIQSAKSLYD